ncbi:MAG: tRNA (adenosine(37)-N6)-dimethylallyltransferase MiaA [Chloroflexi bacterium]|nr:tRNA (adenosine(37)-N6)-dimethylallyltransferase MiaA [Chloroflexota bacterium]
MGATQRPVKRLVAIVGPTATGKSALALRLAERLPGAVIVSADSRQVYRGLDIGTAKPSRAELARVPHALIDVAGPDEPFSLADYQRLAYEAIDAAERPLLVGGTGLYVRAVVDGLVLPEAPPDPELRLQRLSAPELLARLRRLDPAAAQAIDPANAYRLLRAVERAGREVPASHPRYQVLQIGLTAPRAELYRRADERIDRMLQAGWLEEVRNLVERYSSELPALSGLGYRDLAQHVRGELPYADAVDLAKRRTRQFLKRQLTWFRRDERIHWFDVSQPDWDQEALALAQTA